MTPEPRAVRLVVLASACADDGTNNWIGDALNDFRSGSRQNDEFLRAALDVGEDLPFVGDDVTVEHLLSHRSGIGDYLDEDSGLSVDDYPMPVSVHRLATTEQFLPVLDGHPAKFPAGARFSYCNSGYVILALVAERVSGVGFHDLVRRGVCEPAGMTDTAFLRSDALPGDAALGYVLVDGEWRTNVFHLPVLGNGDGGIDTSATDVHRFWSALFGGRIGGSSRPPPWPTFSGPALTFLPREWATGSACGSAAGPLSSRAATRACPSAACTTPPRR